MATVVNSWWAAFTCDHQYQIDLAADVNVHPTKQKSAAISKNENQRLISQAIANALRQAIRMLLENRQVVFAEQKASTDNLL